METGNCDSNVRPFRNNIMLLRKQYYSAKDDKSHCVGTYYLVKQTTSLYHQRKM